MSPRLRWPRFTDATAGALWYLALVVLLPVSSLVIAGLVFLWREGHLLAVLVGWLAITLAAYALFVAWPTRRVSAALRDASAERDAADTVDGEPSDGATSLPNRLAPGVDWSPRDREIFHDVCRRIEPMIEGDADWARLRELSLAVIGEVASAYHGSDPTSRLRFTLPEGLLLVATVSDRYRQLVLTHVPFADRIKLSTLMSVAEQRDTIERGATWINRARRGGRLINPMAAVVGELRDQFTGRVFASVSRTVQRDLMRLLLQEVAQVAIDLYSGRLRSADAELSRYRSRAVEADADRSPEPTEPLRILLVGQVSAGKSSLVNALANSLAAESDLLPTTDRNTVHVLSLDGLPAMHVVDSPGLDDDPERRRRTVDAAFEADAIVWVARANRPGRAPDAALREAIERRFAERPERRPPPSILVLTHVDLLSPRAEWSPPYALDGEPAPDESAVRRKKRDAIVAALHSARRQIGLGDRVPAVPVKLAAGEDNYNTDTVTATLLAVAEAATAAQLNRRRIDRADAGTSWRTRLSQSKHLALGVGRTLLRSAVALDAGSVKDKTDDT